VAFFHWCGEKYLPILKAVILSIMVCKNHQGTTARRKCYACKAGICPECQVKNNHHIFCSQACIQAILKPKSTDDEAKALDISSILNQFDQSLNEDLREYGETIVDQVKENFEKTTIELRKEWQQKQDEVFNELSSLKQGVFSYRNFLQQWVEDKDKQIQRFEKSIRILDKRESKRTKSVTKNIQAYSGHLDANSKSLRDDLSQKQKSVQGEIVLHQQKSQEEVLRRQQEFQDSMKSEFKDSMEYFQKRLDDFKDELEARYQSQSKEILDNISTLLAAQKGNWQEVLNAATSGSKEASLLLRDALGKKLNEQLLEVAKLESDGLKKVSVQAKTLLIDRIQSQLSPWPRRASIAAVTLSVTMLLVIPLLFFSIRKAQQNQFMVWNQSLVQELKDTLRSNGANQTASTTQDDSKKSPPTKIPSIANMSRGSVTRKQVSFTFDGGSNSKAAENILDILKKHQVQSTVFLTGEFIETNPELVKRILADGHEVGNHLYRHAHMVDMQTMTSAYSKEAFLDEIEQVEKVFHKVTGKTMNKFWRAPYGEVTPEQVGWARERGYTHIGWTTTKTATLDTHDWVSDPTSKLFKTPDQIATKIMNFEKSDPNGLNGAIVLMHLGSERDAANMAHKALPTLFQHLEQKGYRLVPVTELINTELAQK